ELNFTFVNDSFYLTKTEISDLIFPPGDICEGHVYINYAKGVFNIQDNKLYLDGYFTTDSTFSSLFLEIDTSVTCFIKEHGSYYYEGNLDSYSNHILKVTRAYSNSPGFNKWDLEKYE
ncbi:MAG: hypothetical protein LRY27_01465, partial [Chitinophagales bacterium]|nr:hypothetical protein [Chitinophagales bacterium]